MAKEETKTEKATIIDGAVLTDKVLETIKSFQDNDNWEINNILLEPLSDSICFFAKNLDYLSDERDEIIPLMNQLAFIREYLKKLKKP